MYIYIHAYIYINMCIKICIYICIYIYVYIYTAYIYMHMFVHVCNMFIYKGTYQSIATRVLQARCNTLGLAQLQPIEMLPLLLHLHRMLQLLLLQAGLQVGDDRPRAGYQAKPSSCPEHQHVTC